MKLRKAIKKIVALGAGASMLGATMFGAMAVDLNEYPSPFVKDGKFSGILAVGTGGTDPAGLAADILGVTDVITSLQVAAVIPSGTAEGTTTVTGDAKQITSAADPLEIEEGLNSVISTLTSTDLDALAQGQFKNEEGSFNYKQYIRFNSSNQSVVHQIDDDDDDNMPSDYLYVKNGQMIFEYELSFDQSAESDIKSDNCDDFENKKITMLGVEYTITATVCDDATPNQMKLTLFGGQTQDTLEEGETKTYTVEGVEYEVTALIIDDTNTKVVMQINGETSDKMDEDDTFTSADGTIIGVTDIIPNEAGDVTQDLVTFYLGADKIVLEDTEINNATTGSKSLEVGDETIEDAAVTIKGSNTSNTKVKLDSIKIVTNADDDLYVAPGKGIASQMNEPQGMFTENWDITYEGLSDTPTTMIELRPQGDDEYWLHFTTMDGDTVKAPIAYTSTSGQMTRVGDDSDNFIYKELNWTDSDEGFIQEDDYFVVNDDNTDDDGFTHILRYSSLDVSENTLTLKDIGSGDSVEVSYDNGATIDGGSDGELILSGKTYIVDVNDSAGDDTNISIDLDNNGNIHSGDQPVMVTKGQGVINITREALGATATAGVNFTVRTFNDRIDDSGNDEVITVAITESSQELRAAVSTTPAGVASVVGFGNFNLKTIGSTDNSIEQTNYGTIVELQEPSGSPDKVLITYPEEQIEPLVYVTAGVVTTSTVAGGSEAVVVQPIEVGATKLDKDVASVTAQNTLSVGGPCVNSVSAEIMGLAAGTCGAASTIPENKGIIKLYENADKVAIVVAGWRAEDTQRSARVLANYGDYALEGTEMEVTGTSMTDISVGKLVAAAAEEAEEEETEEAAE